MLKTEADRVRLAMLKKEVRELEKKWKDPARKKASLEKKKRDAALSRSFGQRKPRLKDPDYLRFIRRQPCVCCGKAAPSEAAHVRCGYPDAGWPPTGMQEKPDDRRTVPLCRACHRDGPLAQHSHNERAWWAGLDIHPPELCRRLIAEYEAQ